jgi:hypothetical protein
MTRVRSKRIDQEVAEGLRLIGLLPDSQLPKIPQEIPTDQATVATTIFRTSIGNTTTTDR